MKKGMKIFIGVGCGLLFIGGIAIVVVVVGFNYLVNQSTAAHEAEGREFGKTHDQKGCMDEGMRRSKSIGIIDLGAGLQLGAFVDACLATSSPTPNFCEGVPGLFSFKETDWGKVECRRAGIDPERTACIHVTKRKHQYCGSPSK